MQIRSWAEKQELSFHLMGVVGYGFDKHIFLTNLMERSVMGWFETED